MGQSTITVFLSCYYKSYVQHNLITYYIFKARTLAQTTYIISQRCQFVCSGYRLNREELSVASFCDLNNSL